MPSTLPCKMFPAVMLMLVMVWMEATAVPFPEPQSAAAAGSAAAGGGSAAAAAAAAAAGGGGRGGSAAAAAAAAAASGRRGRGRGKRHVNMDRLMCLLTATTEGRDGRECESSPSLSPPSCTCVPAWQCRDKAATKAVAVKGNEISSVEVELLRIGCGAPKEVCCLDVDHRAAAAYFPPVYTKLILARGSNPRRDVTV